MRTYTKLFILAAILCTLEWASYKYDYIILGAVFAALAGLTIFTGMFLFHESELERQEKENENEK